MPQRETEKEKGCEEKYITIIDASFLNIPNSSLLNNVPHKEPLDGLVLFFHTNTKSQVKIYSLTQKHIRIPTFIYKNAYRQIYL